MHKYYIFVVNFFLIYILIFLNYFSIKNRVHFFISSNLSTVIYVFAGYDQKIPEDEDLRGIFWEYQIKNSSILVEHVSNGEFIKNGILFQSIPENSKPYYDMKECIRFEASLHHFLEFHHEQKWFVKVIHDTFINISNFNDLIKDLEQLSDPMNNISLAFNYYENFPHGSAFIFSNFAVKLFIKNIHIFQKH